MRRRLYHRRRSATRCRVLRGLAGPFGCCPVPFIRARTRRAGGAHGVRPSQCCSCPRDRGVSAPDSHLPFPGASTPVILLRGAAPLSSSPPMLATKSRSRRKCWAPAADVPPRLLGFVPTGNPRRRRLAVSAADTALGFGLSQVFGTASPARPRGFFDPTGASNPCESRFRDSSARGLWDDGGSRVRRAHARPRTAWGGHEPWADRRPFSVLRGCCLADPGWRWRGARPATALAAEPAGDRLPV
jgi:hypothetical protein